MTIDNLALVVGVSSRHIYATLASATTFVTYNNNAVLMYRFDLSLDDYVRRSSERNDGDKEGIQL